MLGGFQSVPTLPPDGIMSILGIGRARIIIYRDRSGSGLDKGTTHSYSGSAVARRDAGVYTEGREH
jgi:hypothetical protein